MVVELASEHVLEDSIACPGADTRRKVLGTNGSHQLHGDIRAKNDATVIWIWPLIPEQHIVATGERVAIAGDIALAQGTHLGDADLVRVELRIVRAVPAGEVLKAFQERSDLGADDGEVRGTATGVDGDLIALIEDMSV